MSYLRIIGKVLLKAASVIVVFGELLFITMLSSGKWSNVYKKRSVSLSEMMEDMEGILEKLAGIVKHTLIIVIVCILLVSKYIVMYTKHFATAILKREERLKSPIVFWKEFLIREGFGKKKSQGQ